MVQPMTNRLSFLAIILLAACYTSASSYEGSHITASAPVVARRAQVNQPVESARHASAVPAPASLWPELGDSTLDVLIAEARRANGDVLVAEQRLNASRASRRLAMLDYAPRITATGSSLRSQQSMAGVPGLTGPLPTQQLWDVGFDASWEVDIFQRVGRTARAQGEFVASAGHSADDVRLSVIAELARSYFELRGAQRELAVSLRNAENERHILKLAEDRLAAGRGNAFDTERAKSALYLTLAATPTLESEIAVQREQIAVLVGRTPATLPASLAAEGPLPTLPDSIPLVVTEALVARRPDVQAAAHTVDAENMVVGAARADYLPRLSLVAHGGYAATSFDSLSRTGTSRWLAGPMISFPLLDLTRVRQSVDLARAEREVAAAEYRTTVVRAMAEGKSALVRYDRAHARLAILQQAVTSSTRAAALAQERFEAGLTDFLQVLDAQRTLLDAENQLAQGHTAAATALVAVYKAVGGAWPGR